MATIEGDVVIVGAGPTGLFLAGEIASAGATCTVLERRTTESNVTRAFAVHARTLEILDARGLATELVATGSPVHKLQLFDHVHVDLHELPSRYPFLLVTPQYNTERVLEAYARQCGATIVGGAEVTGLAQDDGGVTVRTATDEYRARYVVGADGVHSVVRDAIGLPFPGVSVVKSVMLADVRLADPPGDILTVNAVADGFAFIAPFGDGWYRVFAWNPRNPLPDTAPIDFEEIRSVVRHAFGTDFGMHDPRWMSRFHSDERQAPHYRVGNVLLAGDAAHCHSPAGGQGMNTGIQDAANLGWKLAGTIRGWAPDGLLDTYETERLPVGKSVLRSSGALIRLGMVRSSIARSLRATVGGLAMHVPAITKRAANLISGIGIAYDYPNGGERAPDIELADGRLYHALRTGRFVLLSAHKKVAGGWSDRVDMAVAPSQQGTVTLVRPDAYIAWSGEAGDVEGLREALHTWCGTATSVRTTGDVRA